MKTIPFTIASKKKYAAFCICGQGCAYLGLQMKTIKPHLTLLMSSSHRLFIICSPQHCILEREMKRHKEQIESR
jgi:hypothetical protein